MRTFYINANNIDMCKYWGRKDPGYETTAGELDHFVADEIATVEGKNTSAIQVLFSVSNELS